MGAFVWIFPSTWLSRNTLYAVAGGPFLPSLLGAGFLAALLPALIPLSWWLLIARVIHAETLVGDRQFWVTRPYEWKKLLGAKALFLAVFLYLPLLIAQCLLLVRAGFHPLSFVPGLLFNLLLITSVIVLPLLAITTVTATFAGVTLTLLAGLVCFIGYVAVALHFSDDAAIPYSDHVSMPLAIFFCGTVVVLQYAARRVWLSRLLLFALPVLLVLSGMAVSESTVTGRDYPRGSSGQEAPVQLTLLRDTRSSCDRVPYPPKTGPGEHSLAGIRGGGRIRAYQRPGEAYRRRCERLSLDFSVAGEQQPAVSSRYERILDDPPGEPGIFRSGEIYTGHASFHSRAHTGAGWQCDEHSAANAGLFQCLILAIARPRQTSSIVNSSESPAGLPSTNPGLLTSARVGHTVRAHHRSLT